MKRFLAPAGHIILWKEIIPIFSIKKTEMFVFDPFFPKKKIVAVNSGTSALYYLFLALKTATSKNEVIIPAYTCPTVAAAIIKAGLRPVLCDISLEDFSLLEDDVQANLNENTLAIMQAELFGILPDNSKIRKIVDRNNIFFVGDIAQSLGNYLNDDHLLDTQNYDFLIFSTGRGKPFNILHGGGIVVLKENFQNLETIVKDIPDLTKAEKIKTMFSIILFKFFFNPRLYAIPKSLPFLKLGETTFTLDISLRKFNTRLNKLVKAVLKRYPEIYNNRLKHKNSYQELISKYSKYLLPINIGNKNELIRFPVLFRTNAARDLMINKLEENGIGATGLYPYPLDAQPGLEKYKLSFCPNAATMAKQILTLPIHEYITLKDYEKLSYIFNKYLNGE